MRAICPECGRTVDYDDTALTWEYHDSLPPLRKICSASKKALEDAPPAKEFGDVYALYAFIAKDSSGQEGIVAYPTPSGPMPLIGADLERIKDLMPFAQEAADARQQPVVLALFSGRTDVETLNFKEKSDG